MLKKSDIKAQLESRFAKDLHKKLCDIPTPTVLKDIYKAALRIKEAIERNECMLVVGDYDVDGVVSSVIVSEFFDALGVSNYSVRIPNRFKDGYGLSAEMLDEIDERTSLIITVDNGISAVEAAKICQKRGIDLIITDHHMPPAVLPEAFAIVNPKQTDCDFPNIEICGAQVAWYLVGAIKDVCGLRYDMGRFLELLCVAIVADMMELRDMNRLLVKCGLKSINSSRRAAFKAIKDYYGKERFECDDISFLIAPLINSTGRMDDASLSYRFLRAKNISEAYDCLERIVEFNNSRKEEERALFESSLKYATCDDEIIVTWGEQWHEGVIGIVASRLSKHFKRPAVVFSVSEGRAKGSARSVGKLDILALISRCDELLCSYGGHKGAAGLVIDPENLPLFKEQITNACRDFLCDIKCANEGLLGELDPNEIDFELLELLEYFEPYGQKNPRPFFTIRGAFVKNEKLIGRENNHQKLILQYGDKTLEALFFNFTRRAKVGESIDIVFSVSKNSFRGLVTPQLLIKDILE